MSKFTPKGRFWTCPCGAAEDEFRTDSARNKAMIRHIKTAHRGRAWTASDVHGRVIYRQYGR